MDYKQEYSYNFGFLSGGVKIALLDIGVLLLTVKGDNKKKLVEIKQTLLKTLETCENNLNKDK